MLFKMLTCKQWHTHTHNNFNEINREKEKRIEDTNNWKEIVRKNDKRTFLNVKNWFWTHWSLRISYYMDIADVYTFWFDFTQKCINFESTSRIMREIKRRMFFWRKRKQKEITNIYTQLTKKHVDISFDFNQMGIEFYWYNISLFFMNWHRMIARELDGLILMTFRMHMKMKVCFDNERAHTYIFHLDRENIHCLHTVCIPRRESKRIRLRKIEKSWMWTDKIEHFHFQTRAWCCKIGIVLNCSIA